MKKKICIGLTAVMALCMLAGCNGNNPNEKIDVAPLKECTVRLALPANSVPKDVEFVQEEVNLALKEAGKPYEVSFEFLDETDYNKNILLYATDGYDLAWFTLDNLQSAVQANALRDVTPYLDTYGKNLKDNTPSYAWDSATVDGKIYTIPRNMPVSDNSYFGAARKDWVEEFDMNGIDSLGELDTYFANTYAKFSAMGEEGTGRYVYSADNHYDFLYREYCPTYYFPLIEWACKPVYIDLDPENGKYEVKNFYASEAFQQICQKANAYYKAGYVSPEGLAGSENYFYAGMLGITWSTLFKTSERIDDFKAQTNKLAPDAEIYDIYLNPDDDRYIVEGFENSLGLLSGGKNPNEAVDFLNWVRSSQANHDLVCFGVEGRNYKLTADGRLDFDDIDNDMRYAALMPYWCFNDIRYMRFSKSMSEESIERLKTWDSKDNVIVSDLVGFVPDLRATSTSTAYKNVSASSEVVTNLIDGRYALTDSVGSQTRYAKLLQDVNNAGMQTLIDALQEQVDAYLASKK